MSGQSVIVAMRATTGRLSLSTTGRARMLRSVRVGWRMSWLRPRRLLEILDHLLADPARGELVGADLADRRHLGGSAGQEHLLRLAELVGHDRTLDHLDLARSRQAHHRAAGDAVEEAVWRGRVQLA